MNKSLISIVFIMTFNVLNGMNSLDSLLIEIDNSILNNEVYTQKKENRIEEIKEQLERVSPYSIDEYNINTTLYKEYKPYVCDSAIHYLNKNIEIANQLNDSYRINESTLQLSYLMGSSGMYKEAVDILSKVDRNRITPEQLRSYYMTYDHVYGELAFYTQDNKSADDYRRISTLYKDSLFLILPEQDDLRLSMQETAFRDAGQFKEAKKINDIRLSKVKFGTPEYAVVAFYRSLSYREEKDIQQEKYYLALSALSDIQSAIKDHASLWILARLLYEDGDIERAYDYMRFSWSETVFYNARLRNLQSADIMSLIDKTYQAMIEKQNKQLQMYLIFISTLLIALIVTLFYIYRQMKKLAIARNNLQEANLKLKELNDELHDMNISLQSSNANLFEANQIKEKYIGRFLNLCSTYINKLDAYRRMVYKKASDKQIAELIKITRSPEGLEHELEELYTNFDTAFLQLFPDFVNKFNDLLQENERITPKKEELLNTELRIFALIRLGIEDSSQIAEFLRYSVNTIYNYRAKVKNKARVSREDFEDIVRSIR